MIEDDFDPFGIQLLKTFKIVTLILTVSLLDPCPVNSRSWVYFRHTEKCYLLTTDEQIQLSKAREVCTKHGKDIGMYCLKSTSRINNSTKMVV